MGIILTILPFFPFRQKTKINGNQDIRDEVRRMKSLQLKFSLCSIHTTDRTNDRTWLLPLTEPTISSRTILKSITDQKWHSLPIPLTCTNWTFFNEPLELLTVYLFSDTHLGSHLGSLIRQKILENKTFSSKKNGIVSSRSKHVNGFGQNFGLFYIQR